MAERTPYTLASYDAVATTPRPPTPPTTTGLPRSEGLSRCSTAAKNASRSRWSTDASPRTRAPYPASRRPDGHFPSTVHPSAPCSTGPARGGSHCPRRRGVSSHDLLSDSHLHHLHRPHPRGRAGAGAGRPRVRAHRVG